MTNGIEYTISLRLEVGDPGQLWNAAVTRGVTSTRLTVEELVETIGPRDDPNICDCLAMLFDPSNLPGCRPLSWSCTASSGGTRSAADIVSLPTKRAARLADVQRLFRSVTPGAIRFRLFRREITRWRSAGADMVFPQALRRSRPSPPPRP